MPDKWALPVDKVQQMFLDESEWILNRNNIFFLEILTVVSSTVFFILVDAQLRDWLKQLFEIFYPNMSIIIKHRKKSVFNKIGRKNSAFACFFEKPYF